VEDSVNGPRNLVLAVTLVFLAIDFSSASTVATDIYVAQNAAGVNSGVDCADAHSATWLNSSANWGSTTGQIHSGVTVHLCGTISTALTAQGSGLSGSPVTILFEANARISLTVCPSYGCLNIANKSYIVIDGGTTCGWINNAQVACNGTVQSTASGSSFGNGSTSAFGVEATACAYCEIRNLNISNIYQHTSSTDATSGDFRCIDQLGIPTPAATFLVHNNMIHDCGSGAVYVPGSSNDDGLGYYNNYSYNVNSSLDISNNNNGTLTAAAVHDNHFGSTANWDSTSPLCFAHHNSLHAFAYTTTNSGIDYYNNLIDGNWGNCATSGLFIEGNGSVNSNVRVFNNVWRITYQQENNGIVSITAGGFARFYNNTIIGDSPLGDLCVSMDGLAGATLYFENNIVSTCGTLFSTRTASLFSALDYNVYGGNNANPWTDQSIPQWYSTLAAWKSYCNCDSHSSFGASSSYVGVNANGTLQSGSPAIGAAINLTTLGITTLDSDIAGVSRPGGSTPWDGGVYNSSSSATAPSAPTGLAALVQ
jgi:hypothetical protein